MSCRCAPSSRCGRCDETIDWWIHFGLFWHVLGGAVNGLFDTARQLAADCNECGFIREEKICTRPRGHDGGHRGSAIRRYVPFH